MKYGIWSRWGAVCLVALLGACTAEEWEQLSREVEQNQEAAAARRVKYRHVNVQCSDWEMKGTATAGLSSKGFRVMYPDEGEYGAIVSVNKTAEEHVFIRNGSYFTMVPGPGVRPGFRTKVTVSVHDPDGKRLAEYRGESSPAESYHRSEAEQSACRKAIAQLPSSSSIYW